MVKRRDLSRPPSGKGPHWLRLNMLDLFSFELASESKLVFGVGVTLIVFLGTLLALFS